jgi:hypothetical protein
VSPPEELRGKLADPQAVEPPMSRKGVDRKEIPIDDARQDLDSPIVLTDMGEHQAAVEVELGIGEYLDACLDIGPNELSIASDQPGCMVGTSACNTLSTVAGSVSPSNARRPESISYKMAPMASRSAR